jgi:hypothetical protein
MDFVKIAPFLTHPLVLTGFVLMLFFGLLKALLKAGIIPQLTQATGGAIVKLLLKYGFIIALTITLSGFGIEGYRTYMKNAGDPDVVYKINQALSPIGDIYVSYDLDVPLDADELKPYANRLRAGIESAIAKYKKACIPLDAEAAVKSQDILRPYGLFMETGAPDARGCTVPGLLAIGAHSLLLPDKNKEALANSLLRFTDLTLTFYRKPIQPALYKTIFPATNPPPDLTFTVSADERNNLSYEYHGDFIRIRAQRIQAPVSGFMAKPKDTNSVSDLSNCQLFIDDEAMDPVLPTKALSAARKRIKNEITLGSLQIDLGRGKIVKIEPKNLPSTTNDWGATVPIYTMPKQL